MDEPDADEQFFIFDVSNVQIVVPCLQNGITRMTYHGVCSSVQGWCCRQWQVMKWQDPDNAAISSLCQVGGFWVCTETSLDDWQFAILWLTEKQFLLETLCTAEVIASKQDGSDTVWHLAIRVGTSQMVSSPPMGEPRCPVSPILQLSGWVDLDAQADWPQRDAPGMVKYTSEKVRIWPARNITGHVMMIYCVIQWKSLCRATGWSALSDSQPAELAWSDSQPAEPGLSEVSPLSQVCLTVSPLSQVCLTGSLLWRIRNRRLMRRCKLKKDPSLRKSTSSSLLKESSIRSTTQCSLWFCFGFQGQMWTLFDLSMSGGLSNL